MTASQSIGDTELSDHQLRSSGVASKLLTQVLVLSLEKQQTFVM